MLSNFLANFNNRRENENTVFFEFDIEEPFETNNQETRSLLSKNLNNNLAVRVIMDNTNNTPCLEDSRLGALRFQIYYKGNKEND